MWEDIYIYIYICLCVCVRVCLCVCYLSVGRSSSQLIAKAADRRLLVRQKANMTDVQFSLPLPPPLP